MNTNEVDDMLTNLSTPSPDASGPQQELKIPLLSYRRSSRAGWWLLALPLTFITAALLKRLGTPLPGADAVTGMYRTIEGHAVLTYLVPVIFLLLPLASMVITLLSFVHVSRPAGAGELVITLKYRPMALLIFLVSFALLVYVLTPDALP
ncbi:MAG: hypothetical protein F9K22_12020 [Bacteroidetes bacterium]|nr:MAG: hypothetical protein F9K22_12020 [Bacteroidota bacterium]